MDLRIKTQCLFFFVQGYIFSKQDTGRSGCQLEGRVGEAPEEDTGDFL